MFDTSGRNFAVGLADGGSLVARYEESETGRAAERLLPVTEKLLKEAGWNRTDLQAAGFVDGPGSFTGLRIGLSTALGLAEGLGTKLVGVGTFDSLCETARDRGQPVLCMEDARIGFFYAALYRPDGSADDALPEAVYPAEHLKAEIKPGRLLAGRAWGSRNGELFGPLKADVEAPSLDAVARLVARRISAGEFTPTEKVRPRYYGVSPVSQ